jgi:small subunit ribosomal protein S13
MKYLKNYNIFLSKNNNKNIFSSLKPIHGINFKQLQKISLLNGLEGFERVNKITLDFFSLLKAQANFFYSIEENKIFNNINKKKKIKNYKGMRHILKLPVRGQRTHTNGKTPRKNIKKEI